MPKLILGLIVGFATFATIKHSKLFGMECFHVGGEFLPNTQCLHPALYYGPLAVAVLFIILGVVDLIRQNTTPKADQ